MAKKQVSISTAGSMESILNVAYRLFPDIDEGNAGQAYRRIITEWFLGRGREMEDKDQGNPLVGHFFHTNPEGNSKQGKILGEVSPGKFLIQLFSWMTGESTTRKVASVDEMTDWVFYEDADDWRFAGDRIMARTERELEKQ